jgi:hypothetical protein
VLPLVGERVEFISKTTFPRGVNSVTIGRFAENVNKSVASLQHILADLYRLYALASIEKDLPWFLCHKVLTLEQGAYHLFFTT